MLRAVTFLCALCAATSIYGQTFSRNFFQRVRKTNILLVGVSHNASTLYVCDSVTKINFNRIYDSVKKIAGKRPIIIVTEGSDTKDKICDQRTNNATEWYPSSLVSVPFIGDDTRDHYKTQAVGDSLFRYLDKAYHDDCGYSYDVSFYDACRMHCPLQEESFTEMYTTNFLRFAKDFSASNISFENSLVRLAQRFERKGYYVIVFTGSTHVMRLQQRYDFDYVICGATDPRYIVRYIHLYGIADLYGQ